MLFSRARGFVLFEALFLVLSSAFLNAQANAAFPERQASHPQNIPVPADETSITIPGPMRSLQRMAGISQKADPEEVLPLLARNIYVQGYVGWQDQGRPTEFLILLGRYVNQAEELAALAGESGVVHVVNCQEAEPLLHILGYRLRQQCGDVNAALVTFDQERAFLTVDSGFPLVALEHAVRGVKPFSYHFQHAKLPVMFRESDWTALSRNGRWKHDLLETFLHHPSIARLYWAMYKLDPETRSFLKNSVGLSTLLQFAPDLDFYGSHIEIRSGKVVVPGGPEAEEAWKSVVGANPAEAAEFVSKLLSKDKGWLAAFYDCMARVSRDQQRHFADRKRLESAYTAFRGSQNMGDAARPAFRLASGLLLLLNQLQWDAAGNPVIPGDLNLWKFVLSQKRESKAERDWAKRANSITNAGQVLDAMFAFSRQDIDRGPLQMFLLFSELNSHRPPEHQLKPETLKILASRFGEYSDQYLLFSEFPELDDASVMSWVRSAEAIDKISNHILRGNAMGTFQAEVGVWQILARQQQIASDQLNSSFQGMTKPFVAIASPTNLFDAGREALRVTLQAAAGRPSVSQAELIEMLAGPRMSDAEGRRVHEELAKGIRAIMDGQRLVSLDTLLTLGRGFDDMAKGADIGKTLLPFAGELQEFQMPRPIFTSSERSEWAAGIYNNHHTDIQMQTDVSKVLKAPASREQIEQARGQLAPFFRDTLVGLNYAYYEPPGAQLLRINPLFVRSHDFAGETVSGIEHLWHAPQLFGEGSPAGGGAHLVGSLADLPYALSDAEQDFITPENVQALIWRETVPGLLTNAVFPRWWNVSRNELHAVALYQRAGEELINAAASNEDLRAKVTDILGEDMSPATLSRVVESLEQGEASGAMAVITPSNLFHLTAEYRTKFPEDTNSWGDAGKELDRLCHSNPEEAKWQRVSQDFGVPHPHLAQSYERQLLNREPYPAFAGYSSRLMAESWESNNLYWARLADEMGYPPVMLNVLVPQLTRRMVEKIFATDFEDWPALLRAMREAGADFREGKLVVVPVASAGSRASTE
ncbi:MAG TPA: hypothetical protein VN708_11090 [Terriglobales bacterium]|nr:hypothetical protein [Terriglobales bacterium]